MDNKRSEEEEKAMKELLKSAGSIKTRENIDSQEICREVREEGRNR